MPTKQFAFETGGPIRLQLSWGPFRWSDVIVSLDGSNIGKCTYREFRAGLDFSLPDGSKLHARYTMSGLDIRRDGQPLSGGASDPAVMLRSAYLATLWVGGGNLFVGAISLLNEELRDAFGWPTLIVGAVFLALGTQIKRKSKGALLAALSVGWLLSIGLLLGLPQTLAGVPITAWVLYLLHRGLKGLRELESKPSVSASL